MNRILLLLLLAGTFTFNCIGLLLPNKEQKDSSFLQSFFGLFWGNSSPVRTVSTEVGPAGGTLAASDGSFSFQIPAGALAETKVITISREVSPNGSVPAEFGSATPVFKFEPEGLHFSKPATLTIKYNQGNLAESGIEERSLSMYYIKDDSTLEKMKKVSVDYANNTMQVEVVHFSFGVGLNIQIWLVASGIISNPNAVSNVADRVIDELANYADYGYSSVSEYYQANAGVLGPLLNQLVSVLGTDPITAAFPNADFDGDGAPNFEDPMVPSLGPVITVNTVSFPYISVNGGSNNSTDFIWRSSKTGTYAIRKNASDCNSGTIVFSGNVTANVNNTSGSLSASSLNLGTNALRICVTSAGVTGFGVATVTRDDTAPGVNVFPSGGSYGTIQSVVLNCSDTGGAGCSKVAFTTNGTSPAFGFNCAISNGTEYTTSLTTPNQATTTYKVRTCDHAGNQSVEFSETYTVDTIVPTITINSVLPSTYLKSGQTATISWKSDKEGSYELKSGTSCAAGTQLVGTRISGSVAANETILSEIPVGSFGSEGAHTVFVCVANTVGTMGGSSVDLVIDDTKPTMTTPLVSGTYPTPQTITITCSDIHSGCHEIIYTTNATLPAYNAAGEITNGQLYTGSIITPNHSRMEYRFLAKDRAGNLSNYIVLRIKTGELLPKILSVSIPNDVEKGYVNENTKTVYLAVNSTDHSVIPTFELENTDYITYMYGGRFTNGTTEINFSPYPGNEMQLYLVSPIGDTTIYTVYAYQVQKGFKKEYISGTHTSVNFQITSMFSNNPQLRILSNEGTVNAACSRVSESTLDCNFTPLSTATGYDMDIQVTNESPYHSYTLRKVSRLTVTKNGAGFEQGEIPYCILHTPTSINIPGSGSFTYPSVYARVYYPGLTNHLIENTTVSGEIGYGPFGTDPRTSNEWFYFPATYNPTDFYDNVNNAEYTTVIYPASYRPGTLSYVARFSMNGGLSYTYCDTDGSGSDFLIYGNYYPNLEYNVNKLGVVNILF